MVARTPRLLMAAVLAALGMLGACATAPATVRPGDPTAQAHAPALSPTRDAPGPRAVHDGIVGLRPDRALTPEEEQQRDLLLRLVFDGDGSDIPIPVQNPAEHGWQTILRRERRRVAAAGRLRVVIAHDSIVAPLVNYLETAPPFTHADRPTRRPRDAQEAKAGALAFSRRSTRYAVLWTLAGSASKEAIVPMIRMLDDPQLGRQAYLYLCGLLRFHIGAGLSESDRGRYKANVLFGYVHGAPAAERERAIERTLAWWDKNQNAIELARHFSRAVH